MSLDSHRNTVRRYKATNGSFLLNVATAFNFLAELASYLIVTQSRLLSIGTFFMNVRTLLKTS